MNIPRIVIAGTNSGCGKTTISIGIMAALVKRGLNVQPFKVGPDYIDPMFHTFITGNECRNLDSWILNEEMVKYLFVKNTQKVDISVVEGVMGLYDGFGGNTATGSTAHVSKIIKSPVILIVNGEGLSLSMAALIGGFRDFDRNLNISGIIVNNIKSESHYILLKEVIEENTGITVLGYMPKMAEAGLGSRHLGLIPSGEIKDLRDKISLLSDQVEKTINIELLIKISGKAEVLEDTGLSFNIAKRNNKYRIAVAKDKAFNFYYRDNLDLLEMMGAELDYFSPISDEQLPKDIDGLYIGGGYPEVWAGELERNTTMKESLRGAITRGLPAYAECGGLMYMSESITNQMGDVFKMVGVIPGKSEMTSALQRFGYVDIEVTNDNVISKKGFKVRAHEFHYSKTSVDWSILTCYKVTKRRRGKDAAAWQCGYMCNNLLAGYPHLHFWGNTGFAERFVNNCIQYGAMRNNSE